MIPYAICKRKRNNVEIAGVLCTFFVYLVRAQNCTIGIVAGRTREYEGKMSVCSCVKRQRKTQTFFSVCSKCKISGTTSYCFSADNSEKHPLQISLPLKGKLICKGFRAFRMPIEYNLCTKCNISQYHRKALSLHRACHNA